MVWYDDGLCFASLKFHMASFLTFQLKPEADQNPPQSLSRNLGNLTHEAAPEP